LRILDSKHPETQAVLATAPRLRDFLGVASNAHLARLCAGLERLGIAYTHNERLVRGLDYYNHSVFEWTTTALGAQATVCAGGRYDGLVAQLGGPPTPAVGFAIGLERLLLLWQQAGTQRTPARLPHAYLISQGEAAEAAAPGIAEQLREQLPGLRLLCHVGGGSFKSQFKRADKSGAAYALILGEDELRQAKLALRPLRLAGEQCMLTCAEIVLTLQPILANEANS
jgi:histidyl-tRNA synthetase